ncbi:MAG TPA: pyridoxal-phosphate dependent enzyme, partial [Reyranella sp.]|nr:pyridoxal-phosphate dependent enzyme [Reyranella sp.]
MSRDAIGRLTDALSRFSRVGLCTLPTPLEPMTRLSRHLAGPRLWVKREDCTGPGFGGNKLRKLDYVLHEALRAGVDTLVSGGVVQSNSQRQVAAAAAKLGLDCHLAVYHGRLAP